MGNGRSEYCEYSLGVGIASLFLDHKKVERELPR